MNLLDLAKSNRIDNYLASLSISSKHLPHGTAETNRIPFRAQNFSLDLWKDTFQSWPKTTNGWKDWYLRVIGSMEVYWVERNLDQYIRLSIADM
jgi:hypothetical protein